MAKPLNGFSGDFGLAPEPVIEENIPLARAMNWYGQTFEKPKFVEYAQGMFEFYSRQKSPTTFSLNQEFSCLNKN